MSYTTSSREDYLARHIAEVPLFRALLRAVECRLFEEAGELPDPILDLGCGDGHYADIAFARPLTAGIDPGYELVREAQERDAYRFPVVASATAIPFRDGTFNSVIANCVIEHIPDIEAVMRESARVLTHGGRFVFGVPSEHFAEMLLGVSTLRAVGLAEVADRYGNWFNSHSHHFHTDTVESWQDRLERHGFELTHTEPYISERAHYLFDVLHYLSVPRLVSRKLTGRWTAFPNPLSQAAFDALLRPFYDEATPTRGAYHFFHAVKR